MASRDSYKGSAEDFAAAVKPFAASHGPSFCKYEDESFLTASAKLCHGPKGVEGHLGLLGALHDLQANLSFNKTTVVKVLGILRDEFKKDAAWKMDSEEVSDWTDTLCRRLRNKCRCVGQGELKSKAAWVNALPWRRGESLASSASAPSSGSRPPTTSSDVKYGFDDELLLPYRVVNGNMDPGLPLDMERCRAANKVIATWVDGTELEFANMTVAEVEKSMENAKVGKMPGDLWSGTHCRTNNIVTIKQKVDRSLLLIIQESKKQICMVKINLFGKIEDERVQLQEGHPVLTKAVVFMRAVAEKYISDSIQKAGLIGFRNELFAIEGIEVRPVRKRPAAAQPSSSSKVPPKMPRLEAPAKAKPEVESEDAGSADGSLKDDEEDGEEEDEEEQAPEPEQEQPESEQEEHEQAPSGSSDGKRSLPRDWSMTLPASTVEATMDRFCSM
jgi:hypothetical protein